MEPKVNLWPLMQNCRYGYVDAKGRFAIPPQFEDAGYFSGGVASVEKDGRYGFIDPSGKWVIPPKYEQANPFENGLAAVEIGTKFGAIDRSGRMVIAAKYDWIAEFMENTLNFRLNGKWGYMDRHGNWLIKPVFDIAYPFSEGVANVEVGKKWGFINHKGKVVIPLQYDTAYFFSGGLAPAKVSGKFGYIDKSGKMVIPATYDFALPFSEGIAEVEQNQLWGYIDQRGKMIVPPHYVMTNTFWNGLASGLTSYANGKWEMIDRRGSVVATVSPWEGWKDVPWLVGDPSKPVEPFSIPAAARIRVPQGFSVVVPSGWTLSLLLDDGISLLNGSGDKVGLDVGTNNAASNGGWRQNNFGDAPDQVYHQLFDGGKEAWWGFVHYTARSGMGGAEQFFGTVTVGNISVGVTEYSDHQMDEQFFTQTFLALAQSLQPEEPASLGEVNPLDFRFDTPEEWKVNYFFGAYSDVELEGPDEIGTIDVYPAPSSYASPENASEEITTYFTRAGYCPNISTDGKFLWEGAAGADPSNPKSILYMGVIPVGGKLYFVTGTNVGGKNSDAFKATYINFAKGLRPAPH